MVPPPQVKITVGGRRALTIEQAADRHRMRESSMRAIIRRADLHPAAKLDSRKPVYYADELDAAVRNRPGRGAHLRRVAA